MTRSSTLLIAYVCSAVCVSCADPKQIAAVEKRASELETEVKALKDSMTKLERQQSLNELVKDSEGVAYLTPGSDGYSTLQSDLGRITVKLINVQPYANGSRVTLQFGNLFNATVNGAKATLDWGSVDKDGAPNNDVAKSRDVKFAESLRPGAWTNVQVVLEGVPPAELGFVRVRDLTHTGLALLTR